MSRNGSTTIVTMTVNGVRRRSVVENQIFMLDYLRDQLDLTGAKKGCEQGACGACAIMFDGYPVLSCMMFAVEGDRHKIETIESMSKNGRLHPLQKAFIDHDAFQCGYCTAGQLIVGRSLLESGRALSQEIVKEEMAGNICRCGAYSNIVDAIMSVAKGRPRRQRANRSRR